MLARSSTDGPARRRETRTGVSAIASGIAAPEAGLDGVTSQSPPSLDRRTLSRHWQPFGQARPAGAAANGECIFTNAGLHQAVEGIAIRPEPGEKEASELESGGRLVGDWRRP
jgi:hypothetical protein